MHVKFLQHEFITSQQSKISVNQNFILHDGKVNKYESNANIDFQTWDRK